MSRMLLYFVVPSPFINMINIHVNILEPPTHCFVDDKRWTGYNQLHPNPSTFQRRSPIHGPQSPATIISSSFADAAPVTLTSHRSMCFFIELTRALLGTAPTTVITLLPWLNSIRVGMLRILKLATVSGFSSVQISNTVSFAPCSSMTSSTIGPTMRQGPHLHDPRTRRGTHETVTIVKFSSR